MGKEMFDHQRQQLHRKAVKSSFYKWSKDSKLKDDLKKKKKNKTHFFRGGIWKMLLHRLNPPN